MTVARMSAFYDFHWTLRTSDDVATADGTPRLDASSYAAEDRRAFRQVGSQSWLISLPDTVRPISNCRRRSSIALLSSAMHTAKHYALHDDRWVRAVPCRHDARAAIRPAVELTQTHRLVLISFEHEPDPFRPTDLSVMARLPNSRTRRHCTYDNAYLVSRDLRMAQPSRET